MLRHTRHGGRELFPQKFFSPLPCGKRTTLEEYSPDRPWEGVDPVTVLFYQCPIMGTNGSLPRIVPSDVILWPFIEVVIQHAPKN